MHVRRLLLFLVLLACQSSMNVASTATADEVPRQDPFVGRSFGVDSPQGWLGNAICYGPHRDGQRPGVTDPSAEEMLEDLHLMAQHWGLLRVYGASEFAPVLLSLIREHDIPMQVVLGAWIAPEEKRDSTGTVENVFPEAREANRREVDAAIRLAREYPEIVRAVSIGNETQVFWSWHKSPLDILVQHVRRARAGVNVPVTAADDYNYWNREESRELAAEIDFILMHAHPLWNGLQLEEAVPWLEKQLDVVQEMHPEHVVVIGETGWATRVHDEGEQARLIKGAAGPTEQAVFYRQVRAWARKHQQPTFYFEAFDENWKGSPHPDEVEKHWGVFEEDRSPKEALRDDSPGASGGH